MVLGSSCTSTCDQGVYRIESSHALGGIANQIYSTSRVAGSTWGGLEMGPLMKRLCSHEDSPIDCGLRIADCELRVAIVIAMDLDLFFFEQIGEGRSDLTGQCGMATGKGEVMVIEMECRVPKSKVRYRCRK